MNSKRVCTRVIDGKEVSGEPTYRGLYCIDANGEDLRNLSEAFGSSAFVLALAGLSTLKLR